MKTTLSSKGQVVLPAEARRMLGLESGETLEVTVEGDRMILTPSRKRSKAVRQATDPLTGLPVLTAGAITRQLTGDQVKELLADFP